MASYPRIATSCSSAVPALVLASPVLGQGTGFTGYRIGLIFFLSLLLYAVAGGPVDAPAIEIE